MSRAPGKVRQRGFTLVELLVALGIFLIVTGAAFSLLGSSQKHSQTESQVLTSFQEARLGLDQIVRDVNDAGFPPPTFFQSLYPFLSASAPFAWGPGYTVLTPCQIGTGGGGTCNTPGDAPFVQNVINNSSPAQIAQYQLAYPSMFPTGPVPIFSYTCDNSSPPPLTVPCPGAGAAINAPANIREVIVTLIVAAPAPDATTGVPRIVQLTGRGRRVNPNL